MHLVLSSARVLIHCQVKRDRESGRNPYFLAHQHIQAPFKISGHHMLSLGSLVRQHSQSYRPVTYLAQV